MHSTGGWAGAVDPDVVATRAIARAPALAPGNGFTAGIAAGILVATIAAQLWLARHLESVAQLVIDEELRSLTRLAVSPLWRYGVPMGFAGVCLLLLGLRVRATAVWSTVAAAAVLTLVLTHLWAFAAID